MQFWESVFFFACWVKTYGYLSAQWYLFTVHSDNNRKYFNIKMMPVASLWDKETHCRECMSFMTPWHTLFLCVAVKHTLSLAHTYTHAVCGDYGVLCNPPCRRPHRDIAFCLLAVIQSGCVPKHDRDW